MINLRRDFGMVGKLFGVPRKLLTQLAGFASFWQVQSNILSLEIPAFPSDKNPVKLCLEDDKIEEAAHPEHDTDPVSLESGAAYGVPRDDIYDVADDDGWKRGEKVDSEGNPKGVKLYLCCRSADNNNDGYIYFREVTIDGNGHVVVVGKESEEMSGPYVAYVNRS